MTWEVAVAGTVTLDDVTTPHGRRQEQQGGSAVYFALAAARLARVTLSGAVGRDGEASVRDALAGSGVDLAGLAVLPQPTFRWEAVHDYGRWTTATERSEEGAYAAWTPVLPARAAAAPVLFVGSMRPDLQVAVLEQSRARLVGSDSMTVFIGPRGAEVRAVAEASDVLFLNRGELQALTGHDGAGWEQAARSLCGRGRLRAVVVKAGPLGAAVVTSVGTVAMDAHPVEVVLDPTGAGDALAGGFLGACAAAQRDDAGFFAAALEEGLRCAAAAISDFGTAGLRQHGAGTAATPGR